MNKALRDVLLIIVLFGAILAAPVVMDALSGPAEPEAEKPKAETAQQQPESRPAPASFGDMPPQPRPFDPNSAAGQIERVENDVSREAIEQGTVDAPMPDADCADPDFHAPTRGGFEVQFEGGKGKDTLKLGGGNFTLDGKQFSGMEVIDVRNDEPNKITVLGQGLAHAEGRHIYVLADRNIDTVYLDRCLRWNDPIFISDDGEAPLLRYDTYDKMGNVSHVSVSEGVMVQRTSQK
ncbi:MAG: hypothetical protein EPN97_00490 [Alphaproteobacteria bacterium]|nr:MAG: hypothetical protein EPN97_00490 [Alphaproteobacteria bacterium]